MGCATQRVILKNLTYRTSGDRKVIDFILSFFGATLIYAGVLMLSQNTAIGIGTAGVGIILAVRPVVRLIRLIRKELGTACITQSCRDYEKKIAKARSRQDGDNKPTYH